MRTSGSALVLTDALPWFAELMPSDNDRGSFVGWTSNDQRAVSSKVQGKERKPEDDRDRSRSD